MDKYDDIINLPHPVSKKHPPMSMLNRAAQFAPFAALTGHGAAIDETARLTDAKIELDADSRADLDRKLHYLAEHLSDAFPVIFVYFLEDGKKSGGTYVSVEGVIKSIDEVNQILLLKDGAKIPVADIIDITGEVFRNGVPEG